MKVPEWVTHSVAAGDSLVVYAVELGGVPFEFTHPIVVKDPSTLERRTDGSTYSAWADGVEVLRLTLSTNAAAPTRRLGPLVTR